MILQGMAYLVAMLYTCTDDEPCHTYQVQHTWTVSAQHAATLAFLWLSSTPALWDAGRDI